MSSCQYSPNFLIPWTDGIFFKSEISEKHTLEWSIAKYVRPRSVVLPQKNS
jgi:hypothetical protein